MGWVTEGIKSNPLNGAVLADTGAFGSDTSGNIKVIVASTVAGFATFEHRNAANDTTIKAQAFPVSANGVVDVEFMVAPAQGERFRLVTTGLVVGQIQGSLSSGMW